MISIKRAQIGTEYLIIIGFLTFVIIGILGTSFYFTNFIKDEIVLKQSKNFAEKVISSAETIYYQGEPSRAQISVYLPKEVKKVEINEDENMIVLYIDTNKGEIITGFSSNVPIKGELKGYSGVNHINITAYDEYVNITQ